MSGQVDTSQSDSRSFGFPNASLQNAWTLANICVFLGISERTARTVMAQPDAPPKLRSGAARYDRWNPHQVLAWLHHEDWRAATEGCETNPVVPPDAPGDEPYSSGPWRPAAGGTSGSGGRR